jgi:benzodiazapine receptor
MAGRLRRTPADAAARVEGDTVSRVGDAAEHTLRATNPMTHSSTMKATTATTIDTASTACGPKGSGSVALLLFSLALVAAVAVCGAVFVDTGPSSWYRALHKAPWIPPDWVFAPVWSSLYALMAIAAWVVARQPVFGREPALAITAYLVQLILNFGWTPIFFGAEAPRTALLVMSALVVAVAVTVVLFARVSRVAALLLVPYAIWVAYAWSLNAWIVAAN